MLDATAVGNLRRLLEFLAAGAVQPFVVGDVEIVGPALLDTLEECHHATRVTRLGGANPVVIAAFEPAPIVRERLCHAIDPFARTDARARSEERRVGKGWRTAW